MIQKLQVKNPYSQELVGEYNRDTFESVKSKLQSLHETQTLWRQTPLKSVLMLSKMR